MKSNRLVQIKQILLREGKIVNTDLCERFGISMATARRDLDILESEGIIHRVYGGAVPAQTDREDPSIPRWERRRQEGLTQKESIALRAVEMIPDNCTIYLDSGTTLYEVAKCLVGRSNLTVITNSLRIASLLGMEKGLLLYRRSCQSGYAGHPRYAGYREYESVSADRYCGLFRRRLSSRQGIDGVFHGSGFA